MWSFKPNKFQAYRYKPLSQFSFYYNIIFYLSLILFSLRLIPRRLERRTYSYQKHTLPIKLRNLVNLIRKALNSGKSRALRLELRI